ncbi:hypothetical protein KSS87_022718 [Heliosperma pusillum]|nr:hypothetical protein KSS87_022718 [Heliosperma pusillum]
MAVGARLGVIFVYDLCQRKTKAGLQKWADEIAASGTFSAPFANGGPYGLPVPYIVVSNKVDLCSKESESGSSGNLVDFARHWVEKQGLLSSSEDLPSTASFPGNSALISAAKEARIDKEAVTKFFNLLIKRRYFADEVPAVSPWSISPQRAAPVTSDISSDDEISHPNARACHIGFGFCRVNTSLCRWILGYCWEWLSSNLYNYNMQPPLPAQHNLPPPPTLYPQQPVSTSETYTYPRISRNISSEMTYLKSKRTDIDV